MKSDIFGSAVVVLLAVTQGAVWAQEQPSDEVLPHSGKVAAIGWCYGGGVALSYALGGENHDATAIFYGRLLDDPEKLEHLSHEVYGTFAGLDRGPSPEDVGKFVAALRKAGIENDVHIYDDVDHGFWLWVDRDTEASAAPALDAWRRLNRYLERTLGTP